MAAGTMKTSYYLVPAACIVAAAVTFHTQSSGRSGARELPPVPTATVPLTAESPPPFGVEGVTLPPVVSPPSHFVVPVSAPLAIPAAPTTPAEATLPAIPVAVPTPTVPAAPAALPAIPSTPAMLPTMPMVAPVISVTPPAVTVPPPAPSGLQPLPVPAPVAVNPPAKVEPPVVAPPAVPAVSPMVPAVAPSVPVVPVTPPVAPAIPATPTVAPAVPIIPAMPAVPVLVPPEGVQPKPTPPAPQPQPPVLLPAPTPLPVPTTPLTQPMPGGDEAAVVTSNKFILLKQNKLVEGNVTVTGEKAVLRQGSLERALPKTDVLYVADSKDEIYRFMLAQVKPTDAAARVGVARWLMFAGLREQALIEAREILKLQPANTTASGMIRSLEESLKQFPPEGTPVVAAKPAAGTLVAVEREADVTAEGATTFSARAQPVLANQCMDCHARPDYPGAFKLIRITGFEVGPQSTKANLRSTASQLKKEDPLSSPLLAKALTQHGGMKQPAFVSRLAPGYRTLEAWVSLATPPVVQPMTPPTQPVLPPQVTATVVPPMAVPVPPPATNPVLPAAELVPAIPPAEPLVTPPAVPPSPPPASTDPVIPTLPPTPSVPSVDPATSLPVPSVDPLPIPAPAVPVPTAPLPSVPATPLPDVPLPTEPALPAPAEVIPVGPPPVLPTPPSIPQAEPHPKSSALPMMPVVPNMPVPKPPVGAKPPTPPAPSQFGTALPPKPPATGPTGGDEFDPANFNQSK
ncbi:MAG: hypothetical protein K8U57_36300 [Planctomycetes bacterium]|nr:hypothetical protein [Planctomycetota bacterium]